MSTYGPTGCEVVTNFDTCIERAGGSLDPKGWVACQQVIGDNAKFNECVYNGYSSIVTCFTSFCNQDTSNTVSGIKAALDQYSGYVNAAKQEAQPTAAQQPNAQATNIQGTQQPVGQATQAVGAQPTGGATGNTINNANEVKNAATSSKVSKVVVGFLVVSSVLMNFL